MGESSPDCLTGNTASLPSAVIRPHSKQSQIYLLNIYGIIISRLKDDVIRADGEVDVGEPAAPPHLRPVQSIRHSEAVLHLQVQGGEGRLPGHLHQTLPTPPHST